MHRNDQDEHFRYGRQRDGKLSEPRYRSHGSESEDQHRENQWRGGEDPSFGAPPRGRQGGENSVDGRGSGDGRRSRGDRQSSGGYGERGAGEHDPGRDFGSEGYGVESEQNERGERYERGQGDGQSYGGQRYGGQGFGGGQGDRGGGQNFGSSRRYGGPSYGEGQTYGRQGDAGRSDRSYAQRGFGGQGYEGQSYGPREQSSYGFGSVGADSAPGRANGRYDESGQPGGGSDLLSQRRNQQGRFAGRGPKGYARSDDRIREDVCDRLMADSEVDASEVTVDVKSGEVTLEGSVESKQAKRLAEDIAEEVAGVREVTNRLRVGRANEWTGGRASTGSSDT